MTYRVPQILATALSLPSSPTTKQTRLITKNSTIGNKALKVSAKIEKKSDTPEISLFGKKR